MGRAACLSKIIWYHYPIPLASSCLIEEHTVFWRCILFSKNNNMIFFSYFLRIHVTKLFILTSAAYHMGTDFQVFSQWHVRCFSIHGFLISAKSLEIFLKYISVKNKLWNFLLCYSCLWSFYFFPHCHYTISFYLFI